MIVPCLDSVEWLGQAIDSVLAQDYPSVEIIVADNGSTDGSLDLARSYSPPVRVIDAPTRGLGASRNAGLAIARGEYLQFLDADDALLPGKLRRQVQALRTHGGDVAWEPFSRYTRDEATGSYAPTIHHVPEISSDVEASLLRANGWLQIGTVLVRSSALTEGVTFENGLHVLEDVRFLFELASRGARFVCSGTAADGLLFREHSGVRYSTTRTPVVFANACRTMAEHAEGRWRARGTLDERRRDVLTDAYLAAARILHEHDASQFEELMRHIEVLNPAYVDRLPARLRWLSLVVGYRRAERIASLYRRAWTRPVRDRTSAMSVA